MDIVARVQGIIIKPQEEWEKIKGESITIPQLFTSYALILAAIPAIARFLGLGLIGFNIPVRGLTPIGFGTGFFYGIFLYIGSLATAYVLGIIINALAPSFGSKQDPENAMKLAVFSMTPGWVAGVFYLIPFLSFLAILGSLYGIYVLYLGFSASFMNTPKDKVVGYLIISVIVGIVLMTIVMMILGGIFLVGAVGRFY